VVMARARHDPIQSLYDITTLLGSGTFSDVKLGIEKSTGKEWAVKIISKKGDVKERRLEIIATEINILEAVHHKNIVNLKEYFETDSTYYLVMEKITGGELFDKIVELTSYSEKDASNITKQILEGVQHLHEKRIIHRDLKPENLLLSSKDLDADLKITDFGLSQIFDPDTEIKMTRAVGTPGYIAPEVLDLLENGEPYGKEVDLWGVGVILYILLCGFPPFYGEDEEEVYDKIQAGAFAYPSPYWDAISSSAKDLINHLLTINPPARYTAEQALAHPWIAGDDNNVGNLTQTIEQLKKFNAKRKFRGAINAIKALSRMSKASEGLLAKIRAQKAKEDTASV